MARSSLAYRYTSSLSCQPDTCCLTAWGASSPDSSRVQSSHWLRYPTHSHVISTDLSHWTGRASAMETSPFATCSYLGLSAASFPHWMLIASFLGTNCSPSQRVVATRSTETHYTWSLHPSLVRPTSAWQCQSGPGTSYWRRWCSSTDADECTKSFWKSERCTTRVGLSPCQWPLVWPVVTCRVPSTPEWWFQANGPLVTSSHPDATRNLCALLSSAFPQKSVAPHRPWTAWRTCSSCKMAFCHSTSLRRNSRLARWASSLLRTLHGWILSFPRWDQARSCSRCIDCQYNSRASLWWFS